MFGSAFIFFQTNRPLCISIEECSPQCNVQKINKMQKLVAGFNFASSGTSHQKINNQLVRFFETFLKISPPHFLGYNIHIKFFIV